MHFIIEQRVTVLSKVHVSLSLETGSCSKFGDNYPLFGR